MNGWLTLLLFWAQIVGGNSVYTVRSGDTLTAISARFGVDIAVIREDNRLEPLTKLKPGATLQIDNRHIVPQNAGGEIVVNVPQRMLFFFGEDDSPVAFPVAAGRPTWRTPLGDFEVLRLEENPTWDVPASIQEEMRRLGKPVVTRVPPSPQNPLGEFWVGLSLPGIGIHGTNAPSSIYGLVTHGCIRLRPEDIRNLYQRLQLGVRGRVIYESVLLAEVGGRVYLEVHPDAYKLQKAPFEKALELARLGGILQRLDKQRVLEVISKREGIARDVTLRELERVEP